MLACQADALRAARVVCAGSRLTDDLPERETLNATLNYTTITARAEHDMRAYLELADKHHAAGDVTSQCIARGAVLGVLSMWQGLVADLDGLLDDVFETDRARLSALMNADTAASTPR